MQPEHLARLYNGFHGAGNKVGEFGGGNKPGYPDAARLFEKDREQLLHMAGRNFGGANVGFQIELEDRDVDRRRGVFGREHEWGEDAPRSRAGEESFTAIVGGGGGSGGGGGRNHDSHSDGSEDYDEEELDLEADGRDVVGESVAGERNSHVTPSLTQVSGQDGVGGPFQRMNAPSDSAKASAQKFGGMFPFFNTFAHDNGVRGRPESEGNGVPDPIYFNTMMNTAATAGERRAPPAQQENSVRHFLSDPISGALMEDAFIFPCGHSVGSAGFQRVQETNACVVCMAPTAPMSASPNHALRAAVQAFKRDREFPIMTSSRSAKRRREPDEDTGNGKPKGVQFPYSVSDRVLIKGNKRTPERFVGREAIITTQCLNGWYLVRTIDNGESVRLQYRSLQKIGGAKFVLVTKFLMSMLAD